MRGIIIAGASGHASLVIEALECQGVFRILGLVDSFKPAGPTPLGYEILGSIHDLPELVRRYNIAGGIVAIGDNWTRGKIVQQILDVAPDFQFVSAIHAAARVAARTSLGHGIVVMAGAIVNPGCTIHNHCFLSTNASLDHDSIMESFSSLGPHAATGGNVRLGSYTAVGIGANIIHGITVGAHAVVGAGATVLDHVPEKVVAYGTPARIVRKRAVGDTYL
jgi:sugar O-acyltransferase (sialic acid O-acetyltransferase NeuD family)